MTEKVCYAELTPQDFRERLAQAPIAYLPLGTLEWHGEHLPLGADGLQAGGFFEILAHEVGGIVLPMLFLGPDSVCQREGQEFYGMDDNGHLAEQAYRYPDQQFTGSAHLVPNETFHAIIAATFKQLARAGFRIVVAHGHGPSGGFVSEHAAEWKMRFGLECFNCWGSPEDSQGLGIQVDHAAMNETSLVMALHPELVHMERLSSDLAVWPVGVDGKDPRLFASAEVGRHAIALQKERMTGILRKALAELS